MAATGRSSGNTEQGSVSVRRRFRAVAGHRSPAHGSQQAMARLYDVHYRSLVRLAALLTGDAVIAETIAAESLVALHESSVIVQGAQPTLHYLRRQVLIRSRQAMRRKPGLDRPPGASLPGGPSGTVGPVATGFSSSPLVCALRALRHGEREAVVLTLYLDLSDQDAAALAGLSQAVLRHNLATAKRKLHAHLGVVGP